MSNCINSGLNKIYILTQFNSQSLNRHIAHTYNLGSGMNFGDGFVEVCREAPKICIPSLCRFFYIPVMIGVQQLAITRND